MALTGGQKFCLWMIILGGLALLAGSAAPFWVVQDMALLKFSYGLWYMCGESVTETECATYKWGDASIDDFTAWFFALHATAGLSTLMGMLLVLTALAKTCGKTDSAKGTGAVALLTGLLGAAAVVLFLIKTSDSMMLLGVTRDDNGWGFIVFAVGSGLLLFFGIVLAVLPNTQVSPIGRA